MAAVAGEWFGRGVVRIWRENYSAFAAFQVSAAIIVQIDVPRVQDFQEK